ncbi:acyltransferase [Oxalobacteraceae bacterium CAVE-383]|nr:acyltransferase [Oxalobacteraceae bacterium CAVE-383]
MQTNSRIPCIDALKAVACLFIVSHHLAFYGPMSDVARPLMAGLIDWMYQNGRLAVQVFFVTAGFLLAGKLAPGGEVRLQEPLQAIKQRFLRLAVPYWFALLLAIACAAIVGGTLTHYEVPAFPSLPQLLANIVLLQDLLHEEALSAGVWYVAIDFQLFTFTAILLWACSLAARRHAGFARLPQFAVLAFCLFSLFIFNRNEAWDNTWLYFFGSYSLGMLGYWAAQRPRGLVWLTLLAAAVIAALLVDFRSRIAVSGSVMLLLGLAMRYPAIGQRPIGGVLSYLGRISYSIFLTHYPLCLLVNAVFFIYFPQSPMANAFGMLIALLVSVAGGGLFFKYIENGSLIRLKLALKPTLQG